MFNNSPHLWDARATGRMTFNQLSGIKGQAEGTIEIEDFGLDYNIETESKFRLKNLSSKYITFLALDTRYSNSNRDEDIEIINEINNIYISCYKFLIVKGFEGETDFDIKDKIIESFPNYMTNPEEYDEIFEDVFNLYDYCSLLKNPLIHYNFTTEILEEKENIYILEIRVDPPRYGKDFFDGRDYTIDYQRDYNLYKSRKEICKMGMGHQIHVSKIIFDESPIDFVKFKEFFNENKRMIGKILIKPKYIRTFTSEILFYMEELHITELI